MSDVPQPVIDDDLCTGCTICVDECPTDALGMESDIAVLVDPDACTGCGICEESCPMSAITMED